MALQALSRVPDHEYIYPEARPDFAPGLPPGHFRHAAVREPGSAAAARTSPPIRRIPRRPRRKRKRRKRRSRNKRSANGSSSWNRSASGSRRRLKSASRKNSRSSGNSNWRSNSSLPPKDRQQQSEKQQPPKEKPQQTEAQQRQTQQQSQQSQQERQRQVELQKQQELELAQKRAQEQRQLKQKRVSQQEQQARIQKQEQQLSVYRKNIALREELAERDAQILRQQKRIQHLKFQEQYEDRLRAQRAQLSQARYDYYNDPYYYTAPNYRYVRGGQYYQTNQYGMKKLEQALQAGYNEGYRAGHADREDRWRYDYQSAFA